MAANFRTRGEVDLENGLAQRVLYIVIDDVKCVLEWRPLAEHDAHDARANAHRHARAS